MQIELPGMKNEIQPLARSTAVVSATDAAIQKKNHGSGRPGALAVCPSELAQQSAALIISNEKIEDIIKVAKALEYPV